MRIKCVELHLLARPMTHSHPDAGSGTYSEDSCLSINHLDVTASLGI